MCNDVAAVVSEQCVCSRVYCRVIHDTTRFKSQGILSSNENMSCAVDNFDVSRRTAHLLTGYHCVVRTSPVLYLESPEFKYRHGDLIFSRFPWCFSVFRIKWQDISPDNTKNAFLSHPLQAVSRHSPYI